MHKVVNPGSQSEFQNCVSHLISGKTKNSASRSQHACTEVHVLQNSGLVLADVTPKSFTMQLLDLPTVHVSWQLVAPPRMIQSSSELIISLILFDYLLSLRYVSPS